MSEKEFFKRVQDLLISHLDLNSIEADYLAEHILNIHKKALEDIRQHFIALDASYDRDMPN
jgi:hypothetical protein